MEIYLINPRPAGWKFLSFQPAQSCWQQRRWLALRRSSWPLPAPLHPPSPNFESLKLTGLERCLQGRLPLLYLPLCFPLLADIPPEYQRQKQTCLLRCPKALPGFTTINDIAHFQVDTSKLYVAQLSPVSQPQLDKWVEKSSELEGSWSRRTPYDPYNGK